MLIEAYKFQTVRIVRIVREAEKAVSIQLERPVGYNFAPGQHAVVRVQLPDGIKLVRQYSFSSAPDSATICLTIVQEGDGIVSTWFNQTAMVGDTVELSQPFTGPLVQKLPRTKVCMIAGGSGIAPLMSHLQLRRSAKFFNTVLLYSTRTDELCFVSKLTPLPGESIEIRLTDRAPRFTPEEILHSIQGTDQILICGSRPFVLAMRAICEAQSPADKIHIEAFSLQ